MSKISIVIPALNEENFLPHLLTSLMEQTKKDFEVVVVDGSSSDKTVEVAKSFSSKLPELEVIVSAKASLPLQRNIGARASSGEWLVFIDADSVVLPYFIERIERFIEEQSPVLFTTWFRPDSEFSGDALFTLIANLFVEGSIVFHRPITPGPLTVIRHEIFDLVDGYNETLTFGEDYDFTQRIVTQGITPKILRETLYVFSLRRVRKDGKPRFIRLYAKGSLLVLLTKRNLNHVKSYVMGGHMYDVGEEYIEQPGLNE